MQFDFLIRNDYSTIVDLEEDQIQVTQFLLNYLNDGRCFQFMVLEIDSRYVAEIEHKAINADNIYEHPTNFLKKLTD